MYNSIRDSVNSIIYQYQKFLLLNLISVLDKQAITFLSSLQKKFTTLEYS